MAYLPDPRNRDGMKYLGVILFTFLAIISAVRCDVGGDVDIENTLKTLLTPQDFPTLQLEALRQNLLRRVIQRVIHDEELLNKAQDSKRNLEALARSGYIHTLPDDEEDKRSLANLAKNDQLPTFHNNESKRGIESLARNGELPHGKNVQKLLDELYKRNVASLARNYELPYGKRFLGSLARNGELPRYEKRNIGSIKAQYQPRIFKRAVRNKRDADYWETEGGEYPAPVYQNQNVDDYEELMRELNGVYPEKRFLGSVAKTGWFMPASARTDRFPSAEKRHIGALARLGWLPTLRSVRRFNRSGRSTENCNRETSSNGQAQNYPIAQKTVPLDDKRFLLQPAVDEILLRKMFKPTKTHPMMSFRS